MLFAFLTCKHNIYNYISNIYRNSNFKTAYFFLHIMRQNSAEEQNLFTLYLYYSKYNSIVNIVKQYVQ